MLLETTHCLDKQSRYYSINEASTINESQERMSPAPNPTSERDRMVFANESEEGRRSKLDSDPLRRAQNGNSTHQLLGQVGKEERDEDLATVDGSPSNTTANRELSKGHRSS